MHDKSNPNGGVSRGPMIGAILGSVLLAAVCCLTPILITLIGVTALSAWLGYAGYTLVPALALFVLLIGYRIHRQRQNRGTPCDTAHAADSFERKAYLNIDARRATPRRADRSQAAFNRNLGQTELRNDRA